MNDICPTGFSGQMLLIIGMAVVTYIPRMTPLVFLSSRDLNPTLVRWLEMIPPAVLSAMLTPGLLLYKSEAGDMSVLFNLDNVFLLAAIPSLLVGWLSRNFFATMAAGMGTVALLRYFCGFSQ